MQSTSSREFKYNQNVGSGQPDLQYYAYSMKSLNNFQNALPSDFELLHIKELIFCNNLKEV